MTTIEREWIGGGRCDVTAVLPDGPLPLGRIYQQSGSGWSWRTGDGTHGETAGDYLDAERALAEAQG